MLGRTGKKAAAGVLAAAVVTVAAAIAGPVPAQAAATIIQTATCVDGGGHRWSVRTVWGTIYTDADGVQRIQNNWTGFTSAAPDATTVDYTVRSYRADGSRAQTLRASDLRFNFNRGRTYLNRNPRDPISGPGKVKIQVVVGDGNDGEGPCSVFFTQPKLPKLGYDKVWTTGYTWWDNSPPGSAAISHPVIHRTAGGVGSYADPITLAVAYKGRTPQFPYGTRFYLPKWQKYFIVEDICGACSRVPTGAKYKIDLWLDARRLSRDAARRCTYRNTGATTAVKNPPPGLPVDTSRIC